MTEDHYFSSSPDSQLKLRKIQVELLGKNYELNTANGVFSPGQIDKGTAVLLKDLPEIPENSQILDLGCGWGPIALTAALSSPSSTVWALDINQRALELLKDNAKLLNLNRLHPVTADQIPEDHNFDLILSNPPIRVGKEILHQLLETWLNRLKIGGTAWLVVQKNLGSDSLQNWINTQLAPNFDANRASTSKGFRILEVERLS